MSVQDVTAGAAATPIWKFAIAAHEAGHVVIAIKYRMPVLGVTIVHDDPHRPGFADVHPQIRTARDAEQVTVMLMAGREAEALYFREPLPEGTDAKDLAAIKKIWVGISGWVAHPDGGFVSVEKDLPNRLARLRRRARHLVRQPGPRYHIGLICSELLRRGTMTGEEIYRYLGMDVEQ
jgi:hypothetical protein